MDFSSSFALSSFLPLSCSALKIFYHRKSARLCAAEGNANVKAKLENAPAFSRSKAL
jgi:hypothetical protein